MVKIKLTNIVWDTDGENVELPSTLTVEVEAGDGENERAVDAASDQQGWCIKSATAERV